MASIVSICIDLVVNRLVTAGSPVLTDRWWSRLNHAQNPDGNRTRQSWCRFNQRGLHTDALVTSTTLYISLLWIGDSKERNLIFVSFPLPSLHFHTDLWSVATWKSWQKPTCVSMRVNRGNVPTWRVGVSMNGHPCGQRIKERENGWMVFAVNEAPSCWPLGYLSLSCFSSVTWPERSTIASI